MGLITERCLPANWWNLRKQRRRSDPGVGGAEHILKMLDFYCGNRQKTRRHPGISRKTLYRN
jgi:two-component system NtrC family response regulator